MSSQMFNCSDETNVFQSLQSENKMNEIHGW